MSLHGIVVVGLFAVLCMHVQGEEAMPSVGIDANGTLVLRNPFGKIAIADSTVIDGVSFADLVAEIKALRSRPKWVHVQTSFAQQKVNDYFLKVGIPECSNCGGQVPSGAWNTEYHKIQ